MTNKHHSNVSRAIFYITTAREKIEEIKEDVKAEAITDSKLDLPADELAGAIERALFADTIFKALLGFELIEERLKIALKLDGALEARQAGPLIGIGIANGHDLTTDELSIVMPSQVQVDPFDLLAELLVDHVQCDCDECRAKRSGH